MTQLSQQLITHKRKYYLSLWFWVLIFMMSGILFGYISPSNAKQTLPIISLFIQAIKLIVCPIIFLTIVIGIIEMDSLKQLGSIGLKSVIYFEVLSTIALIVGLLFGYIVKPGNGSNMSINNLNPSIINKYTTHSSEVDSLTHILLNAIPHNAISPFITGNTLQVLFMAIICGIILINFSKKHKTHILKSLKTIQKYIFKLLSLIMLLAPFAAFSGMAFMVSQFGTNLIWQLITLILTMAGACLFFIVIILGSILKINSINIFRILSLIKDEILLVFATSSSESALAPIIQKLNLAGVNKSITGLVIPAGYSFNLDGTNIYLALSITFICYAFNINLDFTQYLTLLFLLILTSKGAAGVTGAGFIVLASTLASMNGKIPVVTITVLLGIDKIMSELRSTSNLIGNSIAAILIAKWDGKLDIAKFNRVLEKE